ncbi:hypothetical protein VE01_04800 [Pseudogymnoascus verrucosus]|uniref:Uncharacterized protein n=1 Tax=Pseudogymnoascus verrucosus TaxID=342668 RepID=A0A1B8GMJ9_9PEZI|nr:uncharacterized protein VE01_04800 [Pseudogymnoascus verrucosus]OBT97036.1 hypothetical protein VE01_04800 [Pseudogymnoascus verrucosus]
MEKAALVTQADDQFLFVESSESEVTAMKENRRLSLGMHGETQEMHSKTFEREDNAKEEETVLPMEQQGTQGRTSNSVEKQTESMEQTHTVSPKMNGETQIHHNHQNQPRGATGLQKQQRNPAKWEDWLALQEHARELRKASENMAKQVEIYQPKKWIERQMIRNALECQALERQAKKTTMIDRLQRSTSVKKIDRYYAKIRQMNKEEADEAALDMIEKNLYSESYYPCALVDKPWIPSTLKWLRDFRAKTEKPQNTLLMTYEPKAKVKEWLKTVCTNKEEMEGTLFMDTETSVKQVTAASFMDTETKVNSDTAATRKQYAEIQSKISPPKPATKMIPWTSNLPIPPPEGRYIFYKPAETRTPLGFGAASPFVSQEQLKKRKREEKKREVEERMMDEELDTEVLPKPKRGKRLNEFEEAMRVAGLCPEDPDKKEKGKGRGKGRENGGKEERPWEEKEKRGGGRGGGRGKRGGFGMM